MSMSGISIDQTIPLLFNDMKLKKIHKYILFKIENKKTVVTDVLGDPAQTTTKEQDKVHWMKMRECLPNEPRYVLYDFGFQTEAGRAVNKIAFIFWCNDDTAKVGDKMIYASTKDSVKKICTGLSLEFQGNGYDDLDYDEISKEIEKKA